jgi:hypothetical protein
MLDPDVRAFDELLAPSIDGLACSTAETSKHEVSRMVHRSLGEALQAHGVQVFLRLEDGAGGVGPETPDAFIRAGRLAYMWVPENESDVVRARFPDAMKERGPAPCRVPRLGHGRSRWRAASLS